MKHSTQRGAAALPVTLLLGFALLLAVGLASRSMLFEVRSSVHQLQAAQAHEAAQAGLAWALGQLNRGQPVGDDCRVAASTAAPWHERAPTSEIQASCIHQGDGWQCHCPATGSPRAVDTAASQAFSIRLTPDPAQTNHWNLSSTGLSGSHGATSQLRWRIGHLPGLDTRPSAALSVRGNARFEGAFGLHHTRSDSGGITLHTGGAVDGPSLVLQSMAGTPAAASTIEHDASLAGLTAQGLHASVFRLSRNAWQEQPAVATIECSSACDTALANAVATRSTLLLPQGLRIDTPLVLGTPERPVLLVIDGPVELHAAMTVHGFIYARHAVWTDLAGSTIRGAVVAENDFDARGTTQIHHDAAVLQALQRRTGVHAPLNGTWSDL